MWKIFIEYVDGSKITLTGKHEDIPLALAIKYHTLYVSGNKCRAMYQQYPKSKNSAISLFDKIDELESLDTP